MGEMIAWMVGWALILEYAVAAGAVSVGWSGYVVGLLQNGLGIHLPPTLVLGPFDGGMINLPAMLIAGLVTWLLVIGTRESATVNALLVDIKVLALQIGSASCRDRVCQYVEFSSVAGTLQKKKA